MNCISVNPAYNPHTQTVPQDARKVRRVVVLVEARIRLVALYVSEAKQMIPDYPHYHLFILTQTMLSMVGIKCRREKG